MALDPITAGFDLAGKLIDRLWADPAQRDTAKLELLKMQQSGELAQLTAATDLAKGQIAVDQTEAGSDKYSARWRPTIGYVCAAALIYQYVVCPIAIWIGFVSGHPIPKPPVLDDSLWQLMVGMLGLGAMRSYEKVQGVVK